MFLVASYLRNRGLVGGMSLTPQQLWSGKKPTLAYFSLFGYKVFCPIDKKDRSGKLGAMRCEGVPVGYTMDSPSVRVWNPRKDGKVLHVGGADYYEGVGKGSWLKRRGGKLGDIEPAAFPGVDRDGEPPTGGDGPTAARNGPSAVPGGPLPPPPPAGDDDDGYVDMPSPLYSADEDEDDQPPPPMLLRKSQMGKRGVPPVRYDEVLEVAADFMSPPFVIVTLEGEKVAELSEAMESGL